MLPLLNSKPIYLTGLLSLLMLVSVNALAHGVDDNTRNFLQQNTGVQLIPFMYIGAKHMLTGYDHLLFLVGGHLFSIQKPGSVALRDHVYHRPQHHPVMGGLLGNIRSPDRRHHRPVSNVQGLR